MRVIADPDKAVSAAAGVQQTVGTRPQEGLAVVAPRRVVVQVAVLFVRHGLGLLSAVSVAVRVQQGIRSARRRRSSGKLLGLILGRTGVVVVVVVEGGLFVGWTDSVGASRGRQQRRSGASAS